MDLMLGYLLVGFVISWIASRMGMTSDVGWKWELAATVLWPLTIIFALASIIENPPKRRPRS